MTEEPDARESSRWSWAVWFLIPSQALLVSYDWFRLSDPTRLLPSFVWFHAFFVLVILGLNIQHMIAIDAEEAFDLLNVGNILDRRYAPYYIKIMVKHWRILYYSIAFSISFFLLVDSLYQFQYLELVAFNSFLLYLFQRAPLVIRRQEFFNQTRILVENANQSIQDTVIDNRMVCQHQLELKRGIRIIYDQMVLGETKVLLYQRQIARQMEVFGYMTNPRLQYFSLLRYAVTWTLTNIILRFVVQFR